MLLQKILIAAFAIALPAGVCDNMTVGDASRPDRASQRYVESLAAPVKARFAALADVSRCRQEDNRFAYDLLLSKLSGGGRAILARAASEGVEEGRSVSGGGTAPQANDMCVGALDRLRAADDNLLVLAERVPG